MENVTVPKAAAYLNRTKELVYQAIHSKKMPATKNGKAWTINIKDIETYKQNRYKREFSSFKGKLKFDKSHGEHSVVDVSKILSLPIQKVYYMLRTNKLRSIRKGCSYVINTKDIQDCHFEIREYKKRMQRKAA